ncbi:hypothetical protein BH11MYX4_BH11MYX4_35940 [soil metagenome]
MVELPDAERTSPVLELKDALARARELVGRARVDLSDRGAALAVAEELDRALANVGASHRSGAFVTPMPGALEQAREARADAEASQRRLEFLFAATSTLLESPLDAIARLEKLTTLVVPDLADWCLCDLVVGDGTAVRRIAVRHWNPEKHEQALSFRRDYALDPAARFGIARALSSGSVEVGFDGPPRDRAAETPEERSFVALVEAIAGTSYMIVPLVAQGRVLAALTFFFSESNRRYGPADLGRAEDLAKRAALAVDNATLFGRLEHAVRARDELVGVVSHDLRNPLSSIQMSAAILDQDLADPAARSRLAIILRNVARMERLVRDLLDLTTLEAGRLSLDLESLRVSDALAEALELVGTIAAGKTIAVTAAPSEEDLTVRADRDRLMQVFSNLLGNATKFTRQGGAITIAAERQAGACRFTVTDTGPGIAPDLLAHVFDRFRQGRDLQREGAGLGLAIAKGIVEAHGGAIGVESVVGAGATFTFTIPLA